MDQKPIKILYQPLKKKWYKMIEAGQKTEEYREGREEWGAEKGKKYLVEVLGRRTTLDGTKLWEE